MDQRIKLFSLFLVAFSISYADPVTKYLNGSSCYCDSLHYEYYATGEIQKEIPYINGEIDGDIYEYDNGENLMFVSVSPLSNHPERMKKDTSELHYAIPTKVLFVIGTGYYKAVHYAGIEAGVGFLSKIAMENNYGYGGLLTFIYAGNCEDEGYEENDVSTSAFNRNGDEGYSTCYEGMGAGIRIGMSKKIEKSILFFYTGSLIYSSKARIQNEDSILGSYTGDSGDKSKMNVTVPFGLNYQSSSIFGVSAEFRTDISFGITVNLALDVK